MTRHQTRQRPAPNADEVRRMREARACGNSIRTICNRFARPKTEVIPLVRGCLKAYAKGWA